MNIVICVLTISIFLLIIVCLNLILKHKEKDELIFQYKTKLKGIESKIDDYRYLSKKYQFYCESFENVIRQNDEYIDYLVCLLNEYYTEFDKTNDNLKGTYFKNKLAEQLEKHRFHKETMDLVDEFLKDSPDFYKPIE